MNDSTKILTVSYGTFSCTLEGFEDPLGSMREVAEYFRDLTADDRYFGAEPPTPDVEMLQNIAEKEVQRHVEARVTETGVALVASTAAATAKAAADPQSAEAIEEAESGPLTFDDDFLMSDEPEDVLAVDPSVTAEADGPAESVAEKLRRIRAVVSKSIEDGEEVEPASVSGAKRDRANTSTIEEITEDLSDDEEAYHSAAPEPADVIDTDEVEAVADTNDEDVPHLESAAEDTTAQSDVPSADEPQTENDSQAEAADDDALNDEMDTISSVLGKVASQIGEDDGAEVDQASVEVSPGATRVVSRTLSPEPEADVGRLLDETDTKLNEDETVRRRRVISQMRAAVAATNADRLVSRRVPREVEEEEDRHAYRDDLSEVVQNEPTVKLTRRESVPPPLMLVSSQRIDETHQNASAQSSERENFAAFAASVGAKELSELLEAAAAYTVFAEGQKSFTRPEIMKRVANADPTLSMSREESLRSFGQLLRQGKFKKLDRGQFTIIEDTKFHPTDRFVGE